MAGTADIDKYAEIMLEIKLRTAYIDNLMRATHPAIDRVPVLESLGLQFRKVFEHIMFASLCANQAEYTKIYTDFAKHQRPGDLIRNLKDLNPSFYPTPVIEVPIDHPVASMRHKLRQRDYLNEQELQQAYKALNALLHAANPYDGQIDYSFYEAKLPVWFIKYTNLLNCHEVHLFDDPGLYVIHMHEEGHDRVAYYRFDPPE